LIFEGDKNKEKKIMLLVKTSPLVEKQRRKCKYFWGYFYTSIYYPKS